MAAKKDDSSFEALFGSLEERARKLEHGNLPLEDSLKLYEEGAEIADKLRELLDGAELRIEKLHARLDADRSQLRELEAAYGEDEE